MEQNCGNCIYMDTHDSTEKSEWGYGKYTGYRCTEKRQYMHPEKDGHSCSYHKFCEGKDSGGCFITTVVVSMCGFDDDSKALTTLRRFRKRILQTTSVGRSALILYDVVGPQIAEKLYEEKDNKLLGYKIYSESLLPALGAIEKQKYYEAMILYKDMVERLAYKYNISMDISDYEYDPSVKVEQMGHGTAQINKVAVNK